MCVLIEPEVIINNAFLAKQKEGRFSLGISDLREFCNLLYDRITGLNDSGLCYKYVYFRADRQDVEEFCSIDEHFIHGIDKVYCIKTVEEEMVKKINSIYSTEVQIMLKNAREDFCCLKKR